MRTRHSRRSIFAFPSARRAVSTLNAVLAMLGVLSAAVFAADVYYLGAEIEDPGAAGQSYSWSQRVRDLVDFSSCGQYPPERSGRISGSIAVNAELGSAGGNTANSFLAAGANTLTDLNLNLQERLAAGYRFEGSVAMRRTDNARVEPDKGVQLKQFALKVAGASSRYEFGDLYADLSPFVLGTSLQGAHIELSPAEGQRYRLIAARSSRTETAGELFTPDVFAVQGRWDLVRESRLLSGFRLGVQASTFKEETTAFAGAGRDTVAGIEGEMHFRGRGSLGFEAARSEYALDGGSAAVNGLAVRLAPAWRTGPLGLRYAYTYVQPDFRTALGSAVSDRVQHLAGFDYRFSGAVSLLASHSLSWDDLPGSGRTRRTATNETNLSFALRPLSSRSALSLRPHLIYLTRDSDDAANLSGAAMLTAGLSASDALGTRSSVRLSYEYRRYDDRAAGLNSEHAHRLGAGVSTRHRLFKRPISYSAGPVLSLQTREATDASSVNLGVTLDGRWDLLEYLGLSFGYSLQDADNAAPSQDYTQNYGFAALELVLDPRRDTRAVLSSEARAFGNRSDALQSYDETKTSLRFISNF